MSELTDKIRQKYPGHYDDLDDPALESAVLAKHPEYKDLAAKPSVKPEKKKPFFEFFPKESAEEVYGKGAKEPDRGIVRYKGGPLSDIFSGFRDWVNKIPEGINPSQDPDIAFSNAASKFASQVPGIAADTVNDPLLLASGGLGRVFSRAGGRFGALEAARARVPQVTDLGNVPRTALPSGPEPIQGEVVPDNPPIRPPQRLLSSSPESTPEPVDLLHNQEYSDITSSSQLPDRFIPGRPKTLAERLTGVREGGPIHWGQNNLHEPDISPSAAGLEDLMPKSEIPSRDPGITSEELPIRRPQALYKYNWGMPGEEKPYYQVQGKPSPENPSGESDLGAEELAKRNIDIAEGPVRPRPKFVNPFDKKPNEDIERMRVVNDKGEEGAALGPPGTTKIFNLLSHNVYKNETHKVIPKELIQNSIDAVKHLGDAGKISVKLDVPNMRHYADPLHEARGPDYTNSLNLEVSDNGLGMDTNELQTVFSNLGESGKENDPTASGGFGLAKAIIYKGSSKLTVESIKDTPNGRIKTTMIGDSSNYDKFMPIKVTKAGPNESTGTTVKVSIPVRWAGKEHMDAIKSYIDNTVKHSNLKGKINYTIPDYEDPNSSYFKDPKTGTTDYSKQIITYKNKPTTTSLTFKPSEMGDHITDIDSSNASLSLYREPGATLVKSTSIPVHLLNNGLYQGTMNYQTGSKPLPDLPSGLVLDVVSKIKEGDPGYPWELSREGILGDAANKLDDAIRKNVLDEILKKKEEALQKLYNNISTINVPNTKFKPIFFDPGERLTPEERDSFINSPVITQAVQVYDRLLDQIVKELNIPEVTNKLEGVGIVLDPNSHGIHIPNNKTGKSIIGMNPFIAIDQNTPADAAYHNVITALHEAAHIGTHRTPVEFKVSDADLDDPRIGASLQRYLQGYLSQIREQGGISEGHHFDWEKRLAEVFAKAKLSDVDKASDELTRIFTEGKGDPDPEARGYNSETERLLQIYKDREGREETTEDLLTGTGTREANKGRGSKKPPSGGDNPNGGGSSSELFDRLRAAIDQGIEKAKEQAASYTAEKSERIKAVKAVRTPGMIGYYERLGKLKGKYEKLDMPPLSKILNPEDIDALANVVHNSPINDQFSKLHALSGFAKLLNGDIPQPSELDILNQIFSGAVKKEKLPKAATPTKNEVRGKFTLGKEDSGTSEDMFKKYRDFFGANDTDQASMRTPSIVRQVYELTRGMMSVDVPFMTSAAFRQGVGLFGTRRWFKAYADSAKSFKDEKIYDMIMEGIANHPIHKKRGIVETSEKTGKPLIKFMSIADQIGLGSSDLKTLSSREEQIRSTLTEKIPFLGRLMRGNNRSYTAFLNSLRTNTAWDWLKAAGIVDENGVVSDLKQAKQIAYTVNELTGYGSLKIAEPLSRFTGSRRELDLGKANDLVSMVFFSPRNLIRDARMLNPLNYMKNDKLLRAEYLKGALRRAGVWAGFTGLGVLLGGKVIDDVTSSDFGKAVYKHTRLDAGSGLLQWFVLMGREALGVSTSSSTGKTTELGSSPIARTRYDVVDEFMRNRIHPTLSLFTTAALASKSRPFHVGSEVVNRMLPMFNSDLHDIMKDDPDLKQIILGLVAAGTSMGSQTYGPKDYGKPDWNIPNDIEFKGGKFINNRPAGRFGNFRRIQPPT